MSPYVLFFSFFYSPFLTTNQKLLLYPTRVYRYEMISLDIRHFCYFCYTTSELAFNQEYYCLSFSYSYLTLPIYIMFSNYLFILYIYNTLLSLFSQFIFINFSFYGYFFLTRSHTYLHIIYVPLYSSYKNFPKFCYKKKIWV